MNQHPHRNRPAGHRILDMLAILQLGLCGRCGRARYATRRTARHASRIAAPGVRLRAYRCGGAWHLTNPTGRPQYIASPVTLVQRPDAARGRLDRRGRGERRYQRSSPNAPARPQGAAWVSAGWSDSDPLKDAHDPCTHDAATGRQAEGCHPAARVAVGEW
ncbi:hypothetical protein [Actinomadura litoris]|uniref:hypothetical protein n=1 Tax=Actinomadura litoris TaxID=2678616 RepID=UPI001FA6E0CA|nr:hypothetical protein [Actinomadura litoris]